MADLHKEKWIAYRYKYDAAHGPGLKHCVCTQEQIDDRKRGMGFWCVAECHDRSIAEAIAKAHNAVLNDPNVGGE